MTILLTIKTGISIKIQVTRTLVVAVIAAAAGGVEVVVVVAVVVVVVAPPYQPPLLHTLLAHIRFTRYLQHFRHVGKSYEASKFTCEFANSSFRFWTCILGGGVGGEGG